MARKTKVWKRIAIFSAIAMMLTANIFSAGGVHAAGENGHFDAVLPTEISRNAGEQGDYVLTVSSNMTISEDNLAAIQAELKAVYEALYGKTDEINEVIALLDALDSKLSGFNSSISDDDWENGVAAAIKKARELSLAEVENDIDSGDYDGVYSSAYNEKINELIGVNLEYANTKEDYDDFYSQDANGTPLVGNENRWAVLEQTKSDYPGLFGDVEINMSVAGFLDMHSEIVESIGDINEYSENEKVAAERVLGLLDELNDLYKNAFIHYSHKIAMEKEAGIYADGARQAAIDIYVETEKDRLNKKIDSLKPGIKEHYNAVLKAKIESELSSNSGAMTLSITSNVAALEDTLTDIGDDMRGIWEKYDEYLDKLSGITLKLAVDAGGYTGMVSKSLTYRDILDSNYTLDDVKINLPAALFSETGKNVTVSSVLSIEVEGEGYEAEQFDTGDFDKSYIIPNIADIVKDTFVGGTDLGYSNASVPGFVVQMSDFVTGLVSDLKDDASSLNEAQIESGAAKPYVIRFNITTNLPVIYGGVIDVDEDVVTLEVVPVEVAVVDCGSQVVNAVAGVDNEAEDALTLADLEGEEPTEEPVEEEATEEETGGFSIFPWVMGGALLLIAFVLIVMYRKKSEKAE